MNLNELLKQPDTYYIAATRAKISESEYLSQSELIYSDADFKHHIRSDGYIKITNINLKVNYIVFLDSNGNIFLAIYKFIPEEKYKEVCDAICSLRKQLGVYAHNPEPLPDAETVSTTQEIKGNNVSSVLSKEEDGMERADESLTISLNGIYDMNNFSCPDCHSQDVDDVKISGWEVIKQCNSCGTQFNMVPSRFYIIKSRTVFTGSNVNALNLSEEV